MRTALATSSSAFCDDFSRLQSCWSVGQTASFEYKQVFEGRLPLSQLLPCGGTSRPFLLHLIPPFCRFVGFSSDFSSCPCILPASRLAYHHFEKED